MSTTELLTRMKAEAAAAGMTLDDYFASLVTYESIGAALERCLPLEPADPS